ncbi:hypothetical protein BC937DRAFT_95193 [Endogone sp. FLAS-F59071]|nr:hypothetical protein BC937DRAFT_95193 [Endogone sp. FLAS-F59071]|eukprot:RUS13522.1 hypothetical protein BC937DRAFT_95193 [Endogone sp. FLAS-F59071]
MCTQVGSSSRTVDGYAASAITIDDITSLDHKLGDYAVKFITPVAKAILVGTEFKKVPGGFRDYVVIELRGESRVSPAEWIRGTE